MTSINGKLDALLQLANENNVNSARTAEIVPQVMGDSAAEEAQAAEMAATGGMAAGMPPAGASPEDIPPEAMGDVPPEDAPMPEEGAPEEGDAPVGDDVADEPMPPVDMGSADMGAQPEDMPPEEESMPEAEPPPEAGGLGTPGGFGDIDWSAYSIDNAYEDFEEALKDEAKEALDAGDTQRVAAITQVMEAMRTIWAQSGVPDGMGAVQPEQAVATGVDGMPAPDMMKSEGEEVTTEIPVDAVKAEEEVPEEEPIEKADDTVGDIASGETDDGESVEAVATSEACAEGDVGKSEEEPEAVEKSEEVEEKPAEGPEAVERSAPPMPTGAPLPSFKSMMEARTNGNPYDCSADEDMLRGVRMGQVYKSEAGTYMVINSSRPNVASAVGMQRIIDPQDLRKSESKMRTVEEDDPLKKALRNDWDNYMAYKQTDSF